MEYILRIISLLFLAIGYYFFLKVDVNALVGASFCIAYYQFDQLGKGLR